MTITVDSAITKLGIEMHLAELTYPVSVKEQDEGLSEAIRDGSELRRQDLLGEAASSDPTITMVRQAFKIAGKDPSRYRPSSEALLRRILAGHDLPRINTAVDACNLASLMTGIPMGLYDQNKVKGDRTLRIGTADETYSSLGRGDINLEGLILLADETGPFGTPFSDSKRTAVDLDTKDLTLVLFGLNVDVEIIENAAEMADQIMMAFAVDESRFSETDET